MIKQYQIEICANSLESALMAQRGGADRVELCENIHEGGTTPSYGTIKLAREKLSIDLYVIIRPRGGDFFYSDDEFEIMKNDIKTAKMLGVDGVVIGMLDKDGNIDIKRSLELVNLAKPMRVTFHRAFDICKDPFQGLEDIIKCGCDRILTSGQEKTAYDGLNLISELNTVANNRIQIMPGSGINEKNILEIYKNSGSSEFHMSLRDKVISQATTKNNEISFSNITGVSDNELLVTNPDRIHNVIDILNKSK